MKPIVQCGTKKPIIMEVIGEKGLKVGELKVNEKDEPLPYYHIEESVTYDG